MDRGQIRDPAAGLACGRFRRNHRSVAPAESGRRSHGSSRYAGTVNEFRVRGKFIEALFRALQRDGGRSFHPSRAGAPRSAARSMISGAIAALDCIYLPRSADGASRIHFFLQSLNRKPMSGISQVEVEDKQKTAVREGSGLSYDGRRMRDSNSRCADFVTIARYDTRQACRCLTLPGRETAHAPVGICALLSRHYP